MEATMSLGSQIKSVYQHLTKSEKKVADYILKNIDKIGSQTLSEMAKKARVGEATIMRFVYKLGYESIGQFKVSVVRESIINNKSDEDDDSAKCYAKRAYNLMLDSIRANSEEDVKKVAKLIDSSSHIYFFGNGTSGYAAEVAAYRFFRAGVSCEGITDVHLMIMKAALMRKNELVIAISLSGDNTDIINATKIVKKNQCPIVTITGRKLSPLSQYGDVNLFHAPITLTDKSYYGGTLGIIIQEFLTETIFNVYAQNHLEEIDAIQQITTIATNSHHKG